MIATPIHATQSEQALDVFDELERIDLGHLPESVITQAIEALAKLVNQPNLFLVQILDEFPALVLAEARELFCLLAYCDLDRAGLESNRKTILRVLAETL